MKRPLSHFEDLENLIGFSYSNFGNSLQLFERPFSVDSPLGYCYKYQGNGIVIYNVVHCPTGKGHTDRRIVAHEYGHIVLGHLDGIHEELDGRILWTIQHDRAELIKGINEELGIDYADKLLNRVIDDPQLNHSLHNIAMDFEVNQQILSKEDIEEMEGEISDVITERTPYYQHLKELEAKADEALKNNTELSEEEKEELKKLKENLNQTLAKSKIKLMIPSRYHLKDGSPFPEDLTYPEYLILIIKNLDQFVKMLVSFKNGGSGDTGEVSDQDVQDALNGEGGQGGMQSLDDLMRQAGMSGSAGDQYQGKRDDNVDQADHGTDSRKDADEKREKGQLMSKGQGCGNSGGASATLDIGDSGKDPVDMAIDEVIKKFKNKVCSFELKKDMTYLYNRGINRVVIAPVYHNKVKLTSEPKIVFLIDVSGSMDTRLVQRILQTIARKMKSIKRGLKYDVIAWSTCLCEHIRDIDPRKPIPHIRVGGGTRMAKGIEYFSQNYSNDAIMVLISDFEDYLEEWEDTSAKLTKYDLYAFNYGYSPCTRTFKNLVVKNFKND